MDINNNSFDVDVHVYPIISKRSGEVVRNQYNIILATSDSIYYIFQSYESKCAMVVHKNGHRTLVIYPVVFCSKTTSKYFYAWLQDKNLDFYYNLTRDYFKTHEEAKVYTMEID